MHNLFYLATLFAVFFLSFLGESNATCQSYKSPNHLSTSEFLNTDFGTLAIRSNRNRYYAFEETGCYDIFRELRGRSPHIYVNSQATTETTTYAAFSVVRKIRGHLRGVPQLSISFYRNSNDDNAGGKWVRARNEENYLANSTIVGARFDVLIGAYESEEVIGIPNVGAYNEIDLLNNPQQVIDWHALIARVPEIQNPVRPYEVLKNTRRSINHVLRNIEDVYQDGYTYLTRLYLNKFNTSINPSFSRAILKLGAASCIYINYSLGGSDRIPINIGETSEILVLRVKRNAEC